MSRSLHRRRPRRPATTTAPPATTPTDPSRRGLLGRGMAAGAGVALATSAGWAPGLVSAATTAGPTRRRAAGGTPAGQLVVVFLRGGMDGLSAVAPVGDGHYHDARPTIGLPESRGLDLDGTFAMHPALAPLHELYRQGRLAVVHACGNPAGSRSHFDAQDLMEQGVAARTADARGWITRHVETSGGNDLFRTVAISANVPRSLRGSQALAIPSVAGFGLGGRSGLTRDWGIALRLAYHGEEQVESTGTGTLDAIDEVAGLGAAPGASAFDDAVTLLGAGLGVEVVTVDLGGWDTHDNMGTVDGGAMAGLLGGMANGLAGFQATLDARGLGGVTTVVMSEFGRRLAQNGSGGTDHGYATTLFVMGAGVAGGRVIADWPGLAPENLDRGDLAVTTDYRDVLWELAVGVLGTGSPGSVFPGHTPTPLGVLA